MLDPQYQPATSDDVVLFIEKLKIMHSIVASILLTDRGKKYVREHEIDFNVQKVYKKLVNFYANSTAARVNASNSFNHATSAKIDSWKGVTEAFIMHWQDQTR